MTFLRKYRFFIGGGITLVVYVIIAFLIISSDSRAQSSTWTVQTLKEYTDQRFDAMREAVTKAEAATEKRFESVNEFRAQLADQGRTFIPRSEYEAGHKELSDQVDALQAKIERLENMKQGENTTLYIIIGVVGAMIGLITFARNILMPKIKETK